MIPAGRVKTAVFAAFVAGFIKSDQHFYVFIYILKIVPFVLMPPYWRKPAGSRMLTVDHIQPGFLYLWMVFKKSTGHPAVPFPFIAAIGSGMYPCKAAAMINIILEGRLLAVVK